MKPPLRHALFDPIPLTEAATLGQLVLARVRRSPGVLAFRGFDRQRQAWTDLNWSEVAHELGRWRVALRDDGLEPGDRVAILLPNGPEWAMFELAAQGLGLVTVPLFYNDRPDNIRYILDHAQARLLIIPGQERWRDLGPVVSGLPSLRRVLTLEPVEPESGTHAPLPISAWLPLGGERSLEAEVQDPDALATIVYTSGTTGRPKGVMLSHRNILWNVQAGLQSVPVYPRDLFLSFLPLSHMLERTAGFYLPLAAGASIAFARSIQDLAEDLQHIRPTILITVPRVFERVYAGIRDKLAQQPRARRRLFQLTVELGWQRFLQHQGRGPWRPGMLLQPLLDRRVGSQVRARLGGQLRFAICGGAPLPLEVARLFLALGIPIVQGYGLTETGPVVSVNRVEDNRPEGVGRPLTGVEVRVGANDELLTRSPSRMLGYWRDPEATARVIDPEGWFHTGDQVWIEDGHIYITGRLKELIVLSNGEKLPPTELEMAIIADPLWEQILVIGEGRPYLAALAVPRPEPLTALVAQLKLPPDADDRHPDLQQALLERVNRQLHAFPGYAKIRRVALIREPWTLDNDLLTPTLKLRRQRILEHHAADVARLYAAYP